MANKMVFINLPVENLERSKAFFTALGYTFSPEYTDDKAACLVLDEGHVYSMLITKPFFQTFIQGTEIADATKVTEALLALTCESREEVDLMMEKVLSSGGAEARPASDYGWMYARAFTDLDGHIWETFFMDESKKPANPGAEAQ
ncbi:MAG: VOC family protein [Candidatus Moraniibacteriota bacterium]